MFVATAYRAHRAENSERHGQVESSSLFANICGSEIDGDRLIGISETRVEQRRFDSFAALPNRGVRHSDGNEIARIAAGIHVDFDVDQMCVDSKDSGTA